MFKYVIKRLIYEIPVFLGITFALYLLINLAPGGPLAILASSGEMSQADLEAMRIALGLDKPIIIRYFLWLADLFHGDLGTSYRTSQDVAMMISQRIQPSLTLTGVGIVGAILIGIPLGIISAYKPNSIWDHIKMCIRDSIQKTADARTDNSSVKLVGFIAHLGIPKFRVGIPGPAALLK